MALIGKDKDGKDKINSKESICELLKYTLPSSTQTIDQLFKAFDTEIKKISPKMHQNSFNRVHGDWYEWLLAIYMWNYRIDHPNSYMALNLPKISQFDCANLYNEELRDTIVDLRHKVLTHANVELITSNPDFVIIDTSKIKLDPLFNMKITTISPTILTMIDNAYSTIINQCGFNDIVGYLASKTSFRSDRRLQIPHEGSLMKALYVHLQTRNWIINPNGLKYYAFATKVSEADKRALNTVATHSLTSVHSLPEKAVDAVYEINTIHDELKALSEILEPN